MPSKRRMSKRLFPRPAVLLSSLTLTACVATVILIFTLPGIYRWHMLSKLDSNDIAVRQEGYSFASARLNRPAVLQGVLDKMQSTEDDTLFMQLVQLLDLNGLWNPATIPHDLWLRRIQIISDVEGQQADIIAAQMLADRHDMADNADVLAMLNSLAESEDVTIRYAVLLSAAELAGAASNPQVYRPLISELSRDADEGLAYQAWIMRGLLGFEPSAAEREAGQGVPAMAQQAYDYARGALKADELAPMPEAAAMPGVDQILLAGAEVDPNVLGPLFASDKAAIRELGAVIAARRFDDEQNRELARELLTSLNPNSRLSGAILVGLTGIEPVGITGDFASVLAANPTWTEDEVREFSDEKLASLGLARQNILDYWLEHSRDFVFLEHLRVARWMQGGQPEMDGKIALLRGIDSFPSTTLALAMLHRSQTDPAVTPADALDRIINPRGEPREDLVNLLAGQRWVHVIRPYLFDGEQDGGLTYAWWADAATQQMQTDVLRNWMLVHRGAKSQ